MSENVTIVSGDEEEFPDVAMIGPGEMLLGVWYRTRPGERVVKVASDEVYLPRADVRLGRGLEVIEAQLVPMPSIRILAGGAPGDEWPELKASVRDAVTGEDLRETSLRPGEPVVVERVKPRQVQITLSVGDGWQFVRSADLRVTQLAEVDFGLSPFKVRGTLLEGDRPAAGTLKFRSDEHSYSIAADDDGHFEFDAWVGGRYLFEARAASSSNDVPPYSSSVVLSSSSPEITVHLPVERIRVHVIDAGTSAPLQQALVGLRNTWIDPTEGQRRFASRFYVDANGEAILPPIHAGEAELFVEAAGYVSETRVIRLAPGTDRLVEVRLKRDSASSIQIALPNGEPGVGAEAISVGPGGGVSGWRSVVDADGMLRLPTRLKGEFIVVRHPAAASFAVRLDDVLLARGAIRLQPHGPELHVAANVAGSENPIVALWLYGVRLDGWASAFAAWAGLPYVNHTGVWRARNLPPVDVRVIVIMPRSAERLATGALDSMFTTVRFPWSGVITVPLSE